MDRHVFKTHLQLTIPTFCYLCIPCTVSTQNQPKSTNKKQYMYKNLDRIITAINAAQIQLNLHVKLKTELRPDSLG